MSTQNETMILRGFFHEKTKPKSETLCNLKREEPFSAPSKNGKHYGMPISTYKFLYMLYHFWLQIALKKKNPFKDVWWVDFSKASLFRILAQKDCEYIRFYLAIPGNDKDISDANNASLALEGLDCNGKTIKHDLIVKIASTMNGQSDDDPEAPHSDEKFITELTNGDSLANNEEKGNGGSGNNKNNNNSNQDKNIQTLSAFIGENKEFLVDKSFQEFIRQYYNHAQENFS
jgi:hypothetical protein